MMDKIIGVTVGTPISPKTIADKLKPVLDEQIAEAVDKYLEDNPVAGTPGKDGEDGYTPIKGVDYFDGKDGVTPDFSIGTVETREPGSDATASISGTAANPVLNLGIPKGLSGKTPVRGTDYWTSADIAEIKSYVDEAILGGAW